MKQDVISLDNKVVGSVTLSKDVFGIDPRADILHRVVNWQLAKRRLGLHKTKQIGDVSGTTKKPFAQKGTGRARAGSLRAPQMRGGAIIFGPVVRSHAYSLPKKIRALGLKMALSSKIKSKEFVVLENEKVKSPKTKELSTQFKALGWDSVLVVTGAEVNVDFAKAISNVKHADVLPVVGLNVYDILNHDRLVLTQDAVDAIQKRLG